MSTVTAAIESYQERWRTNRLGLWLFFLSESFMFAGLLAARLYLWGDYRPPLDQRLGVVITLILLISSYFMFRADTAIAHGDQKGLTSNLLITAFLGLVFLVGVVGFEWRGEVRPSDGAFGAVLFGMTGMHAFHVLTGIIFIMIVWANARRGLYTKERHWGVEACAIYWHFVDMVWAFYYPALYLLGTVPH